MSAVRGWCPDLFAPMQSGDGMLLRIKPRFGRLDASDAVLLADAALRHGNGAIETTNRGNLQFRGFSEQSARSFAEAASSAGLASANAALERRRNLLVSPLLDDDPGCAAATRSIAEALERGLEMPGLKALPAKFGFLVDGGGALPLGAMTADIGVRATPDGWRLEAGGAMAACTADDAASLALSLAASAGAERPSRATGSGTALFARAGLACMPAPRPTADAPIPIGPVGALWFGVGTQPGQFDAATLRLLAELAIRRGDGVLRITPFRSILVSGLRGPGASALAGLLSGRLIDPTDPRVRTASCIGAPGCRNATVPAPADAARLSRFLPPGTFLHVSGCEKGCGHPAAAPLTLVGRDGRYDLVRDGRANDAPCLSGLAIDAGTDLRTLLDLAA